MIRIRKPGAPPLLLHEGEALTSELCRLVDEGAPPRLEFHAEVYGAPQVKEALRRAQHGKCCFCESKVLHVSPGDVEHFRPKRAVRQAAREPLRRPGYYWLAYRWSNLLLSCAECNRRHKGNLFPLEDDLQRARSHHDPPHRERPLFIDPSVDEPEEHIRFRRESAIPRGGSRRGHATIEGLSLNRAPLRDRRSEKRELVLRLLDAVFSWLRSDQPDIRRARVVQTLQLVVDFATDSGEYAAMCRGILREAMHWRPLTLPADGEALLAQLERDAEQGKWLAVPPY